MSRWVIEKVVHFGPGDLINEGFVHFGFHDAKGRQFALAHQKHFLGPVGKDDTLDWTVSPRVVFDSVPNIEADISYPMYVSQMLDGTLVVSCIGNNLLYRIDESRMVARLFADCSLLGMKNVGNCVVDDSGLVWVNDVEGCKVWKFDMNGRPVLTLGDGVPGFQASTTGFDDVRFNWVYDIRKGPDGNIYVLDSKNFAVRVIDLVNLCVRSIAGSGMGGHSGDGGCSNLATFGSNSAEHFDGPWSLSLDEEGNVYVGDWFNHVVRMIYHESGLIETIAGKHVVTDEKVNSPEERDPLALNLPRISSMDYYSGRLLIPTDLEADSGDLIALAKKRPL